MRAVTGSGVHMLSTVLLFTVLQVCVHAQNTILVGGLPSFALGHQWGAADLDKRKCALHSIIG